jgi:hypothetical protein
MPVQGAELLLIIGVFIGVIFLLRLIGPWVFRTNDVIATNNQILEELKALNENLKKGNSGQ